MALSAKKSLLMALVAASVAGVLVMGRGGEAVASPCAESCRAQHNQCRITNKGSPSCDAALTRCLGSCTAKK